MGLGLSLTLAELPVLTQPSVGSLSVSVDLTRFLISAWFGWGGCG